MKKTMKKIGAALLAAMMVMSVTGCSQGGNTAGTSAADCDDRRWRKH